VTHMTVTTPLVDNIKIATGRPRSRHVHEWSHDRGSCFVWWDCWQEQWRGRSSNVNVITAPLIKWNWSHIL
jgi:hypothetical protein